MGMIRSAVSGCALLCCLAMVARTGENIPDVARRVNDYAGVLSAPQAAGLEEKLAAHERATSNQIVVVAVRSLEGRPIESVSLGTAAKWRIGQKGRDNGVLLFVAVDDRRMRIEVGRGLEGVLPDIVCGRIIREDIGPAFKQGRYYQGIAAGTDRIIQAVGGQQTPGGSAGAAATLVSGGDHTALIIGLLIGLVVVIVCHYLHRGLGAVAGGVLGLILGISLLTLGAILGGALAGALFGAFAREILGILFSGRRRWYSGGSRRGGSSWGGGGFSGGGGSFSGGGASGGW
jgi:uncharacterized protein